MKSISKAILIVLFFVTFNAIGEGTKEVMPITSNGLVNVISICKM